MTRLILSLLPKPRRPIAYIYPDVSIKKCVQIMMEQDIGALVVANDENILGILSERDIVRRAVGMAKDPEHLTAGDALCSNITILNAEDAVEMAMQAMLEKKRRHILVREAGDVIAILSIGDILFSLLEDNQRIIEHLENYIHTY